MFNELETLNFSNITLVGAFHWVLFTLTMMCTHYEQPVVSEATVFASVWACRAYGLMMRQVVS